MDLPESLSPADRDVLRRLAGRKAEIAAHSLNAARREAWYRLDRGEDDRPMILAEFEGVQDEVRPIPEETLQCSNPWARKLEWGFRAEIYRFEQLQDDHVVEPYVNVRWQIHASDYGVRSTVYRPDNAGHLGARRWDPALRDLDAEFHKLRPRSFRVDRDQTLREVALCEHVFQGILPVRIRGSLHWTMGLTQVAIDLVGLEGLMLLMYDNPSGLHRLMAFLRDDHRAFTEWLEQEGLYSLNNENDYIGSGSMGYTRRLPQPDYRPGMPVRRKDLWVLSESQETAGVSPEQFEQFIFPYQKSLTDLFGRVYYGCCEPLHTRINLLQRLPNLARVSVAPWADEGLLAEACGRRYVYSRKPNPSLVSTSVFCEDAIREDVRRTLRVARGCRLELIMKDVHTLHNEPKRLARWVALTKEVVAQETGIFIP